MWRKMLQAFVSTKLNRQAKRRCHGFQRLSFEPLEHRRMLAPITVNTLVDENDGIGVGDISLRDAIAAAMPGDIIDFAVSGTIILEHGELSIDKDLSIVGPGSNLLTIDASGNDPTPGVNNRDGSRIFNITEAAVSISGLRLTGGDTDVRGGAIYAYFGSSLTLDEMLIEGNAAPEGGGIYFDNGNFGNTEALTIGNSIIRGNEANFFPFAGVGDGGGVYIQLLGDVFGVDIFNTQIEGNVAARDGGGLYLKDISDDRSTDLSIRDSVISGNKSDGNGGGLYVFLQADLSTNPSIGQFHLERTTIAGNTATLSGGGAFLLVDSRAPEGAEVARIDSCTISGNTAYAGQEQDLSAPPKAFGGGGGLYLRDAEIFSIARTVTTINNSTISGNRALNGGGIYASPSYIATGSTRNRLWLRHTTIAFNIAGPFVGDENAPEISRMQQSTGGGGIFVGAIPYFPWGYIEYDTAGPEDLPSFDHAVVANNTHLSNEPADHDHYPFDGEFDDSDTERNRSNDLGVGPQPSDFGRVEGEGEPLDVPKYTFEANYSIFGDLGPSFHEWNVFNLTGSWIETDPMLNPALADNGGPTLTHLLLPGSPAIDAGNPAAMPGIGPVPLYDQRGTPFTRVYDGNGDMVARIDIGAVEVQPIPVAPCPIGDYNNDGVVDAADYTVWRNNLGAAIALPNEDLTVTPGMVTIEDYAVWKQHYGETCLEVGHGQLADETIVVVVAVVDSIPNDDTNPNSRDIGLLHRMHEPAELHRHDSLSSNHQFRTRAVAETVRERNLALLNSLPIRHGDLMAPAVDEIVLSRFETTEYSATVTHEFLEASLSPSLQPLSVNQYFEQL